MLLLDEAKNRQSVEASSPLSQGQSAKLRQLLDASSRTFALTIPLLPQGLQQSVELGYLILRGADAIEDATHLPLAERLSLLDLFRRVLLETGDADELIYECRVFAPRLPVGGERSVLLNMDLLLLALDEEDSASSAAIRSHCERVVRRMASWLTEGNDSGQLKLSDLGELSDYMYSVAGIVGELLTDLFVEHNPNAARLPLRARAPEFGAALQLTNIIKDAAEDAQEGRQFLPEDWYYVGSDEGAEQLHALLEIARARLRTAVEYTGLIPVTEIGIRQFCLAPIVLALATLEAIARRADEAILGATIKVERERVPELLMRAAQAVNDNEELWTLHAQLDESIDRAWAQRAL